MKILVVTQKTMTRPSEDIPTDSGDEDNTGDENEVVDWLGSDSDEADRDDVAKREKSLKNLNDEFFNEMQEENYQLINRDQLEAPAEDEEQVRQRVEQIIATLEDYSNAADPTISRSQLKEKLYEDLCLLYGYNRFLLEKLLSLVKVSDYLKFLDANENQRPVTIRVNTIRTHTNDLRQNLNDRGVRLEPIPWNKLGLIVVESQVPVGATPEYLSGHYMLQSPSSFLPVIALNPTPDSRVLDMCAAPGGKTTHMAQLMKNKGTIIANDFTTSRCSALVANIHRLGVTNAIVVNYNGLAFPDIMGGFDYVLCDAPCSGTGVISRDPSVKSTKSERDLEFLTKQQKELILHAFDSVKPKGGKLCYCTCSVLVEENEAVVDYLLNHREGAKCIEPPFDPRFDATLRKGITRYGKHIFNPQVQNSRRIYPHDLNMDGFFLALIDVLPHEAQSTNDNQFTRKGKRTFTKKLGGYNKK